MPCAPSPPSRTRASSRKRPRIYYYRTLRQWERNLTNCRDEAVNMVGEEAVRDFQQYLRISAFAFKRNHICLLRMSFAKR
jgi:cyclopropane fatty-acyl-phospholipid synthase-like methyltransferase